MSTPDIKKVVAQCEHMATSHRVSQRVFHRLSAVAEGTISHEDVGQQLMEVLGSSAAVRTWVEQNQALVETILKSWYMGARLYELEKQGEKK